MKTIASVFYKRLLEAIKQTKDKQSPNDDIANLKLYAVSDLAMSIIISKTTNFVVKEFPVEATLPSKCYTEQDKTYINLKTYLPPELIVNPPKKSGLELEMLFANARTNAKKPVTGDSIALEDQQGSSQLIYDVSSVMAEEFAENFESVDGDLENHQNSFKVVNSEGISITELKNVPAPAASPTTANVQKVTKRPRGRPRVHPLPSSSAIEATTVDNEICENTPPNSVDKKKESENMPESGPEAKRQKLDEENITDTQIKYQQYWEKHCQPRSQTSKNPNGTGPNKGDKSTRSDEQGNR